MIARPLSIAGDGRETRQPEIREEIDREIIHTITIASGETASSPDTGRGTSRGVWPAPGPGPVPVACALCLWGAVALWRVAAWPPSRVKPELHVIFDK
eukprot:349113-Prymnesium_polylepis.1